MITNLSYSLGHRLNYFIDQRVCLVNYASFDDTIAAIQSEGRGPSWQK